MTSQEHKISSYNDFRDDFETALREFRVIRQQNVRTAADGREFILVPRVTARLNQRSDSCGTNYKNDLDRLVTVSYLHVHRKEAEMHGVTEEKLARCLALFYILLDMRLPGLLHLFTRAHRTDEQLPLSLSEIKAIVPETQLRQGAKAFYDDFCKKQLEWRPMTFEMNMEGNYTNQIVPCYRRERIQPERDGRRPGTIVGQNARIWSIEVPEELTGPALREQLPLAKIGIRDPQKDSRDRNAGVRYQLALKTFPYDKRSSFEDERDIFQALNGQRGIIKFVGWYQSVDPSKPEGQRDSFTLVLELAAHDLYQSFRDEEAPPVTAYEIHNFWTAMLEIALALKEIHHDVKIGNRIYDLIHGDIKPENILRVADRFKLADPGEGRVQLATSSDQPAMLSVLGGTVTYAAPEKSAWLTQKNSLPQKVGKSTDVWSLGCVFSVAATFLVLGREGVLQYERVRLFDTEAPGDAFHNGSNVLEVVTKWHIYLRLAARAQDIFTKQVLDAVDEMMLRPADERKDSKELCSHLQTFLALPEAEAAKLDAAIPERIAGLLHAIDVEEGTHHERTAGIERAEQGRSNSDHGEVIVASNEQLPAVKPKTTLHAERLLPTAQRTQGRSLTVHSIRNRRQSDAGVAAADLSSLPSSRTPTMSTDQTTIHSSHATSAMPTDTTQTATNPRAASHTKDEEDIVRPPFSLWQMQKQLEARNEKEDLPQLKRHRFKRFSSIFTGKRPELPTEQSVREDEDFHRNSFTKDDPINTFLRGRDIVYIVDNGSSMWWYWTQVAHWMRILAWRTLGYDDNGMELWLGNDSKEAFVKENPGQSVRDFTDAMQRATPRDPKGSDPILTDLQWTLEKIINDYMAATRSKTPPKPKTIIVLTDGAWHGTTDEYAMDNCIKYMLQNLMQAYSPTIQKALQDKGAVPTPEQHRKAVIEHLESVRPITIQFIRFGHDRVGMKRLNRLDDDLKGDPDNPMYPDLVDTEPADGDFYKMIGGSLSRELDSMTTLVSSLPSISSQSSGSTQEGSSRESRSDTVTSTSSISRSPLSPPQEAKMPFEDVDQHLMGLWINPTLSSEPASAALRHSPEQIRLPTAGANGRKTSLPVQRRPNDGTPSRPPPQLHYSVTSPTAPPEIHFERQPSIRQTRWATGDVLRQPQAPPEGSRERREQRNMFDEGYASLTGR